MARQKTNLPLGALRNAPIETSISPGSDRDDFMLIEGIDPVTEMALNSLGVRRFRDFGDLVPAQLSRLLHERTGVAVSAEDIAQQNWIAQAAALDASEAPQRVGESGNGKDRLPAAVEQQVVLPLENKTTLQITGAVFEQVKQPKAETACSSKKLRATITCEVLQPHGEKATAFGPALCAQIHAMDEASGNLELWAWQTLKVEYSQTVYLLRPEFKVEKPGQFRLYLVVQLLSNDPKIFMRVGPVLRVL